MQPQQVGRLILIRHGETEANHSGRFAASDDIPLTEAGRRQTRDLAVRLAVEFRADTLLSSSYLRARQTAELIGEHLGLQTRVVNGIQERNFGCLRGQPYRCMGERMMADPAYDVTRPWSWSPPDGESLDQVRARVIAALEAACAPSARDTIVVSHGAVIQAVCAHLSGEWLESFVPPNCGIRVIEFDRLFEPPK